jgi:hypothetical protein
MPVEVPSNMVQIGRSVRVEQGSPSNFYHLSHVMDTDISVKGILGTGYITSSPTNPSVGDKYIIVAGSPISISGSDNNDILEWNGSAWTLFLDVSNTLTNFGMVYDRNTKRVYQYDSTEGWRTLIVSKSTIDGGTFP